MWSLSLGFDIDCGQVAPADGGHEFVPLGVAEQSDAIVLSDADALVRDYHFRAGIAVRAK